MCQPLQCLHIQGLELLWADLIQSWCLTAKEQSTNLSTTLVTNAWMINNKIEEIFKLFI